MIKTSLNSNIESNKTRHFLILSFVIIILLIIFSSGVGFHHLSSVQYNVNQIIETQNAQLSLMHKMRSIARERIIKLQALSATEDSFQRVDLITEFHQLGGFFLETRLELLSTSLTEEEQTLLKIQRDIARRVVNSQYKVIELVEMGANREALDMLVYNTVPMQNENMSLMDQFILYQNHQNQVLKSEAQDEVNSANKIVIVLSLLSVLLTIIVAIVVIKRISNMLRLLSLSNKDNIKKTNKLAQAHDLLEHKVAERTKELQELNQTLKHIAGHDSLTNLPNRRLFSELLNQEIKEARRNHYNLAILYMDLDGFKAINDALGHDMGDTLLVNISNRLKSLLRNEDLIARLGGDEFTISLSNIKYIEDVKKLCQIIIDKVSEPMFLDKHECHIGISIGVSMYPENGEDENTLMRVADAAMYQVKKQGKNNFVIGE